MWGIAVGDNKVRDHDHVTGKYMGSGLKTLISLL